MIRAIIITYKHKYTKNAFLAILVTSYAIWAPPSLNLDKQDHHGISLVDLLPLLMQGPLDLLTNATALFATKFSPLVLQLVLPMTVPLSIVNIHETTIIKFQSIKELINTLCKIQE